MIQQAFFLLLCLLPACSAWAEVYQCQTGRGTINYTNIPCIDEAPRILIKQQRIGGKKVEWIDPSEIALPSKVTLVEPITTTEDRISPPQMKVATLQDSYTTPIVESSTERSAIIKTQATMALMDSEYQVGMRWMLRTSGTYITYEQYEITGVENQIISWTHTLLNANKEPFAGGLSETFTMDLRQQDEPLDSLTQLRLGGYVFDVYEHQTEQATSWHVGNLPLITPLIHYRSGDKTELIEFNP